MQMAYFEVEFWGTVPSVNLFPRMHAEAKMHAEKLRHKSTLFRSGAVWGADSPVGVHAPNMFRNGTRKNMRGSSRNLSFQGRVGNVAHGGAVRLR